MFAPKFTLSTKIVNNLSQIERLYGRLEGLHIPQRLELNLERNNLLSSTYISNSIEGNSLSLSEVTNLLLDSRVPINRDEQEVKNYFQILQSLVNYSKQSLSTELVIDLHTKLLQSIDDSMAGQIRDVEVVVGKYSLIDGVSKLIVKHKPPFHKRVDILKQLNNLINWTKQVRDISPILLIAIFHHQYVYIHPFVDGNGRTCRLLTAILFLKHNYQINKYFVLDDYYDLDREQYSDKLSSADKGDKTEWIEYFTDGVKYSLQSALNKLEQELLVDKVANRPTNREKEIIAYFQAYSQATSSDLVNYFQFSRQQAHKFLSSLVKKGYLIKKGTTKGSYYQLK